ncbi:MAG TPA: hypothetical protein VIP05_20480 [Burkholderiaceae bacterium]
MYLLVLALVLAICLVPVKLGAHLVGAKRHDVAACFGALVLALLAGQLLGRFVHVGGPALHLGRITLHAIDAVVLLVAALAYMAVLGTTYLRGLAVAAIQFALGLLLVIALAGTELGPMLHRALR